MKINTLAQFEAFLKSRIPSRETLFVGDLGIQRSKYFMKLLSNPQNKIKVIHIAGTSGKGSTANLVSHILQSQGFSVGLSVSPHVFDIRERMQINNNLPNEKTVLKYFNQILPTILQMEFCKFGMPTFFEINVALAYHMFAQEKLDYAVMETGLGGRLDATNTVTNKNKICLITKIGLDHTEILGKTISKIALEKAGIIQNGNTVISNWSLVTSNRIIESRCEEKNAELIFVKPKTNYKIISSTPLKTVFDFHFVIPGTDIEPLLHKNGTAQKCNSDKNNFGFNSESELNSEKPYPTKLVKNKGVLNSSICQNLTHSLKNISLGLIGLHQAENCSLALACLAKLSQRDKFQIDEKKLRNSLENISIPGRCEIRKINDQTVIIDGAHNPQKMQALTINLSKIYPNQKFVFIVAFKKGKDYMNMLSHVIPLADQILLTSFSVSKKLNHLSSVDNQEIAQLLKSKNFHNFKILPENYSHILENMRIVSSKKRPVVITGSLHLIGKIYNNI